MPARTKKIRHDDETRAKIRAAQIINRFHDHLDGKIELSPTQVSCGKALLAKVLPDLAAVQHSGEVTHNYVAELPQVSPSVTDWQKGRTVQ